MNDHNYSGLKDVLVLEANPSENLSSVTYPVIQEVVTCLVIKEINVIQEIVDNISINELIGDTTEFVEYLSPLKFATA